jgi:hypothetical protein
VQVPTETLAQPIEIFYPGSHTDFRGKKVSVNRSDLEESVSWFNASGQRLPLVIGHPNNEDDRMGFGSKLALDGDRVVIIEAEDVDPTFRKIVNSGELPRVSAMLRLKGHPSNKSGGIEFQHVGFFGKSRIALDKLRSASFAADQQEQEFLFMAEESMETERDTDLDPQGHLDRQAQELADRQAAFAAEVAAFSRARAIEPEIERWVRDGRVLPAEKSGLIALFAAIPDELEVAFSEASEEVEQSASDFLRDFLAGLPQRVSYGEMSAPEPRKSATVSFAAYGSTASDDDVDTIDQIVAAGVDVTDTAAFCRALEQLQEV